RAKVASHEADDVWSRRPACGLGGWLIMKARQRIARFGLPRRNKLRNLQHPHAPRPFARIDITHGRVRRAQVDADDIASGLFFNLQINRHRGLVGQPSRLANHSPVAQRWASEALALRIGVLPHAELQLPATGGFGALAPQFEDAEFRDLAVEANGY